MSDGRFAGIDWACEEHAVCVVDERGRIVEGRRYRRNEQGIRALCARLARLQAVLVALEFGIAEPGYETVTINAPAFLALARRSS